MVFGADAIHRLTEQPVGLSAGGRLGLEFSLRQWVNDGLMTLFFLLVGLELEREQAPAHAARMTRSRRRSCFSISMMANSATPTATTSRPSSSGTGRVSKIACSGGR